MFWKKNWRGFKTGAYWKSIKGRPMIYLIIKNKVNNNKIIKKVQNRFFVCWKRILYLLEIKVIKRSSIAITTNF